MSEVNNFPDSWKLQVSVNILCMLEVEQQELPENPVHFLNHQVISINQALSCIIHKNTSEPPVTQVQRSDVGDMRKVSKDGSIRVLDFGSYGDTIYVVHELFQEIGQLDAIVAL